MTKESEKSRGIECPKCGCRHFHVLETRATSNGVRRRRECRNCGRTLTTVEKVEPVGSTMKRPS